MSDYDFDMEKAAEMTLALMALCLHDEVEAEDGRIARTWKSYAWGVTDYLHEQGMISDPRSKAKSVVLTPEGLARSRALFQKHFGKGA